MRILLCLHCRIIIIHSENSLWPHYSLFFNPHGHASSTSLPSSLGSMLADWSGQGSDSAAVETSSVKSSEDGHEADGHSSDSSFLTDADFASALARAAELSGMTVVGTTVTDPKAAGEKIAELKKK